MSKTTAISIIVGAVLLMGAAFVWWYMGVINEHEEKPGEGNNSSGFNFFPFGNNNNEPSKENNNEEGGEKPNEETNGKAPVIRQISTTPTAGFTTLNDRAGLPFVRYIEEETGNVYEAPLETISNKRLTNTTIPEIRNVLWLPGGNSFIARYLGDDDIIETFSGTISEASGTTTEGTVGGKFLSRGIIDVSLVSPKDKTSKTAPRIFYITETQNGSSGFLSGASGTNIKTAFSSPFKEWVSYPTNEDTILLQTKPSGLSSGFLFSLSTKTGGLQKLLSGVGLITLPNKNGSKVLYSEITGGGVPKLSLYDVKSGAISAIALGALADKCVWSDNEEKIYCAAPKSFPKGTFPDDWYKGKAIFTDSIWEISLEGLSVKMLADLPLQSTLLDIDQISLDDKSSFVVVRNKTDNTLWSVRIVAQ